MSNHLPDTNVGNIEYIRKQDAFDAVDARIDELMTHPEYRRKRWDIDLSGIIRNISAIKPADVAPVVHAHWIRHENADIICGYYVPSFECSQCGTWKEDDSDFCPDCGAKMDEMED